MHHGQLQEVSRMPFDLNSESRKEIDLSIPLTYIKKLFVELILALV